MPLTFENGCVANLTRLAFVAQDRAGSCDSSARMLMSRSTIRKRAAPSPIALEILNRSGSLSQVRHGGEARNFAHLVKTRSS